MASGNVRRFNCRPRSVKIAWLLRSGFRIGPRCRPPAFVFVSHQSIDHSHRPPARVFIIFHRRRNRTGANYRCYCERRGSHLQADRVNLLPRPQSIDRVRRRRKALKVREKLEYIFYFIYFTNLLKIAKYSKFTKTLVYKSWCVLTYKICMPEQR